MKKNIISAIAVLMICSINYAQVSEKYKAVYLYRVIQNINWRSNSPADKYTITVLGNSSINWELNKVAKSPKAVKPSIEVKKALTLQKISDTHILYIPSLKREMLKSAVSKFEGSKTIIITDEMLFCENGVDVNFIFKGNKLKLEINKQNIELKGLKVNESLIVNNLPCN